jgi:hypothetical protein
MSIEIKIPAGHLALQYHIGQALKAAAIESGYEAVPDQIECNSLTVNGVIQVNPVENTYATEKFTPPEAEFNTEQADSTGAEPTECELITPDTPDADGIVWDKRIHSQGQTRNADNTWRLARKPKDKSEAEWNEYVEAVKAELLAVVAAEDGIRDREQGGELNTESGEVFTDPAADPVPPAPAADPVPPAPAADPVPPAPAADPVPPAPAADPVDEQLTFAKVIAFATANKSKLPSMDELNKVYADLAASMNIPVTNANAPIVAFAKAGPNVLSTLKTTIEGLING